MFVSTEAVLFGTTIVDVDEAAPVPKSGRDMAFAGGDNAYCVTKREVEAWLTGPEAPPGLEVVIVRPRLIWGDEVDSTTKQLAALGRSGALALFGAGARASELGKLQRCCYTNHDRAHTLSAPARPQARP